MEGYTSFGENCMTMKDNPSFEEEIVLAERRCDSVLCSPVLPASPNTGH